MRFRRTKKQAASSALKYRLISRAVLLALLCLVGFDFVRCMGGAPGPGLPRGADNVLPPTNEALGAGVFISTSAAAEPSTDQAEQITGGSNNDGELFGLDRRLLHRVLDKTAGIPQGPYFHLVDVASRAYLPSMLQSAATEDRLTYANLWNEPELHRGALVRLTGTLRGAVRFEVDADSAQNPAGVTHLFQGDLFTEASHPRPYILVVPSMPERMPRGIGIAERVEFVGFFLKLWRYRSAEDVDRAAPLLIGRIVSWTPAPAPEGVSPLRVGIGVGLLAMMLGFAWLAVRLGQGARRVAIPSERSQTLASLDQLAGLGPPPPSDGQQHPRTGSSDAES